MDGTVIITMMNVVHHLARMEALVLMALLSITVTANLDIQVCFSLYMLE